MLPRNATGQHLFSGDPAVSPIRIEPRAASEASAADKVALVYAMNGANRNAAAASRTLGVIDGSQVVFYLDRSLRAGFFTLTAGDTAVKAYLTHLRTLVVARAFYHHARGVVDKMDYTVGAGLRT